MKQYQDATDISSNRNQEDSQYTASGAQKTDETNSIGSAFERIVKRVAEITEKNISPEESKTPQEQAQSPLSSSSQIQELVSQEKIVFKEDPLARPSRPRSLNWSIVWSDLMMTMFILFLVMFIYQRSHMEFFTKETQSIVEGQGLGAGTAFQEGGAGSGSMEEGSISRIYDLSRQALESGDVKEFASIDLVEDKTVRIILKGDLLFETGKAELRGAAKESLMKIAGMIRNTPYMINVVGHTDSVPIHNEQFPTNWELSVIRATSVARFLIDQMKMPGKQFFVSGHAYFQPVAPNDTENNRRKNRRVEIIISKERPSGESSENQDLQ